MAIGGYGFSRVPDKGFMGFHEDLQTGAWGSIDIAAYNTPDQRASVVLISLPADVCWKLRATWAIDALAQAAGAATQTLLAADKAWDSTERKLHLQTALQLESADPEVPEASTRVRVALLYQDGIGHTQWSYDKEVDFGRTQVLLAGREPLKSDIALLGLQPLIQEIDTNTELLATANGRGNQASPRASRSVQIREALVGCVTAFNGILDDLDWMIEHQAPGAERDRLVSLRAPLLAVLARYPAEAVQQESTAPPSPPATPAPSAPQ